jgi:hypothetical protein
MFQYTRTMGSLQPIASAFHVDLFEKDKAQGRGMVIAIGSGLLMATMDALPQVCCAVEYDKRNRENPRFIDFLSIAAHWVDFVAVHTWFSISKPAALMEVLQVVPPEKLIWKSNFRLFPAGYALEAENFEDLVKMVQNKFG